MIILKSDEEIEGIEKSCKVVAYVLSKLKGYIRPGITTKELDEIAEEEIRKKGANPSFKGYRGFPATLCVSINNEVVHGIPGKRVLKEGDIVSLDIGADIDGFYGDGAMTFGVGRVDERAKKLMRVTEEALYVGIGMAFPGNRLSDISHAIQKHVESYGFSVVRDFVGHGIGRNLHEDPQIPNFGDPGKGPKLEPGMVFAIEPMVNEGDFKVGIAKDGWTVKTLDGKRSAHFEHTIAIKEEGPKILTFTDNMEKEKEDYIKRFVLKISS